MVCIMLGSTLFTYLTKKRGLNPRDTLALSVSALLASMAVCSFTAGPGWLISQEDLNLRSEWSKISFDLTTFQKYCIEFESNSNPEAINLTNVK